MTRQLWYATDTTISIALITCRRCFTYSLLIGHILCEHKSRFKCWNKCIYRFLLGLGNIDNSKQTSINTEITYFWIPPVFWNDQFQCCITDVYHSNYFFIDQCIKMEPEQKWCFADNIFIVMFAWKIMFIYFISVRRSDSLIEDMSS